MTGRKVKFMFLLNQELARSKGGREQGRKESLVKCSVFVLW